PCTWERCENPDCQPYRSLAHRPAHDHRDHSTTRCSQGHPYANFRSAPGDGVGSDTVQSDGCQQQRQAAEQCRQLSHQTVVIGTKYMRWSFQRRLVYTESSTTPTIS